MAGIYYEEIWAEGAGFCYQNGNKYSPPYGFLARISKDFGPMIKSPLRENQPWLTKIDSVILPSNFNDCDGGRNIIYLTRK